MKAIENLKAEHEEILLMLDVLERMSEKITSCESFETDHLKQVLNFFEVFAEQMSQRQRGELPFCGHSRRPGSRKAEICGGYAFRAQQGTWFY